MAVNTYWRTFKNASWLGWQMESNWAEPWLFLLYSVVRPIAGTLILVVMYMVITGGNTSGELFAYMYVGNALFMYVAQVLFGITWVIHDDREHYQTLKYIYISPANFYMYILGRSISKIIITTVGVIITLAFGVLALDIPIGLGTINWPLLILGIVIGLTCIISFGLALAGVSFLTAKHAQGMNEGIAGLFYLFCGVIFPLSTASGPVLPTWSHPFALILPVTYWMHIMRAALFGIGSSVVGYDTALSGFSTSQGLLILFISTLVFIILSILIFRLGDHLARKKGLIDMTTAY
jgi:ABC-2 type transport system permease protein